MDTSLDGNAAAGALGDMFAFDVTMAVSTCAICGDPRPVAELRAYMDAPGIVLRCASCGAAQLRLVRSGDGRSQPNTKLPTTGRVPTPRRADRVHHVHLGA